jgi:hypothetical protein
MSRNDFNEKQSKFLSGLTTIRYREPTSTSAKFMTQYVVDYSNQKAHIPDRDGKALMEATNVRDRKHRNINNSGKSCAMGPLSRAFIGSSPDDPNNY